MIETTIDKKRIKSKRRQHLMAEENLSNSNRDGGIMKILELMEITFLGIYYKG